MRVTVIDYKAGNLTSVLKALRHLGAEVEVTDSELGMVAAADRIVLPGVGHFAATHRLDATGLTRHRSIADLMRYAIVNQDFFGGGLQITAHYGDFQHHYR